MFNRDQDERIVKALESIAVALNRLAVVDQLATKNHINWEHHEGCTYA